MKEFRYQLHTHTAPCSACAGLTPYQLCKALHQAGYSGAVLTNHFYKGNCGIPKGDWQSFVYAYEKDYQECVECAKEFDLDILFGIEEGVGNGLEILCYGITPKVLYDNPSLRDCKLEEWVKIMRDNGVVLIQSHPYRQASYITNPGVLPLQFIEDRKSTRLNSSHD